MKRALLAGALAGGVACAGPDGGARLSAQEKSLERRLAGLRGLLAGIERNGGRQLRLDHVLIVVRQRLIQQVLDAGLPYERVVAGRYRVRVASARILLEDGFAELQLEGRASLEAGGGAAADVAVYGGLDVVDLDTASGVLKARVKVFAVEARRTEVMGVDVPARQLVEELSKEKVEAFEALVSSIEIPVRLKSDVELPGLGPEGGVTIRPERIPVGAGVSDVQSFHHRLWISIRTSGIASPAAVP